MPNTEWLYVADYVIGIARVSRVSGKVERLSAARGLSTYGTDGLAQVDGDLIVIQNGAQPHRVARLTLDASGAQIANSSRVASSEAARSSMSLPSASWQAMHCCTSRTATRGSFRDGRYAGPPDASGLVVLRLPLKKRD